MFTEHYNYWICLIGGSVSVDDQIIPILPLMLQPNCLTMIRVNIVYIHKWWAFVYFYVICYAILQSMNFSLGHVNASSHKLDTLLTSPANFLGSMSQELIGLDLSEGHCWECWAPFILCFLPSSERESWYSRKCMLRHEPLIVNTASGKSLIWPWCFSWASHDLGSLDVNM